MKCAMSLGVTTRHVTLNLGSNASESCRLESSLIQRRGGCPRIGTCRWPLNVERIGNIRFLPVVMSLTTGSPATDSQSLGVPLRVNSIFGC